MPQTNQHSRPAVDSLAFPVGTDYSCSWCADADRWSDELMPFDEFPSAFVWTKMQAEAGQPLEAIVRRKELERCAGGGLFFWGIGNALGDNLRRLVAADPGPAVLFSIMRSKPKRQDVDPRALLIWTAYVDLGGRTSAMPPHALVLSRGETTAGDKRRHYALVCQSAEPLRVAYHGKLDLSHFRNLGSTAPRVGASQVTAVVEHGRLVGDQLDVASPSLSSSSTPASAREAVEGPAYDVNMRAKLAPPYFVRLARPLLVPADARAAVVGLPTGRYAALEWLALVAAVRGAAEANKAETVDPEDLFGPASS
jgi:hypothetical protein